MNVWYLNWGKISYQLILVALRRILSLGSEIGSWKKCHVHGVFFDWRKTVQEICNDHTFRIGFKKSKKKAQKGPIRNDNTKIFDWSDLWMQRCTMKNAINYCIKIKTEQLAALNIIQLRDHKNIDMSHPCPVQILNGNLTQILYGTTNICTHFYTLTQQVIKIAWMQKLKKIIHLNHVINFALKVVQNLHLLREKLEFLTKKKLIREIRCEDFWIKFKKFFFAFNVNLFFISSKISKFSKSISNLNPLHNNC